MSVDLTKTESQQQGDETPHKDQWRWGKVLQEDNEIHSLSLEDIYISNVAVKKRKYLQFCLCYMAQTNGANLVKNPEKHLVLFSRFTCCDLEHGHHTALLLVPKMKTSTWEDPDFHCSSWHLKDNLLNTTGKRTKGETRVMWISSKLLVFQLRNTICFPVHVITCCVYIMSKVIKKQNQNCINAV